MPKKYREKQKKAQEKTEKGKGTRYSCLYSTVRKKTGTTYSPKY